MKDPEIRDEIVNKFQTEFPVKFDNGTREHNPDGDKGLWRMSIPQLAHAVREEVYDLLAYVSTMEKKFLAEQDRSGNEDNNKK
tara:strand:+ start:189 stop:437 length:249 start_codon:yes stop_codon:yes gene_type:complete